MDLDLSTVRTMGRPSRPLDCEIVRELNSADMALLASSPRGVTTPSIKRIRDSHHAIARLIAEGMSNTDIGACTGYSQSRISILKGDPAFEELVSFYREAKVETSIEALQEFDRKAIAVRNAAVEVILDRLEDEPDSVSLDEALDITKVFADRTGHGPQTKSTAVTVTMNYAEALAARRRRDDGLGARPALPSGEPTSAVQLAPPSDTVIEGTVVE